MELKEGMTLFASNSDQVVGKVNRFVLDPVTHEVTHVVIEKGGLFSEDKVLPFEMVSSDSDGRIALKENTGNLDKLPAFRERQFVRTSDDVGALAHPILQSDSTYYWYPTFEQETPPEETVLRQFNIPEHKVLLKEGARVMSSDQKHVGDVERLLVDSNTNKATHFLITQGLLFKDRKLVPVHWVKSFEEDKVTLAVSSQLLEDLPSYES